MSANSSETPRRGLLIGYEPESSGMYPQVREVISVLRSLGSLDYFAKDDRGLSRISDPSRILGERSSFGPGLKGIARRVLNYQRRAKKRRLMESEFDELTAGKEYDYLIAIDHNAISLGARANARRRLLWSLVFLCADHPWMKVSAIRSMVARNRREIDSFSGVIIQDETREACLASILGTHGLPTMYLPVSLTDSEDARIFADKRAQAPPSETIKLLLLTPAPNRGAGELVVAVRQASENIRLSLNGDWFPDNIDRDPARFENLQRSPDVDGYRQTITRHDIGVLCYRPSNLNDVVISRSSGQLVDYLRLGIPVVAFLAPEIGRFVAEAEIGAVAHDATSLDLACRAIRANYGDMSRRARALFERHYDFRLYSDRLKEFVCSPDPHRENRP
jgi:hypothetical protein